jgi:hypothetical protein
LVLPITASDLVQTMTTITFCAKAARSHFALAPFGAAPMLHRESLAHLHIQDDFVDLCALGCCPYSPAQTVPMPAMTG